MQISEHTVGWMIRIFIILMTHVKSKSEGVAGHHTLWRTYTPHKLLRLTFFNIRIMAKNQQPIRYCSKNVK